jgi:hypothetical protein
MSRAVCPTRQALPRRGVIPGGRLSGSSSPGIPGPACSRNVYDAPRRRRLARTRPVNGLPHLASHADFGRAIKISDDRDDRVRGDSDWSDAAGAASRRAGTCGRVDWLGWAATATTPQRPPNSYSCRSSGVGRSPRGHLRQDGIDQTVLSLTARSLTPWRDRRMPRQRRMAPRPVTNYTASRSIP